MAAGQPEKTFGQLVDDALGKQGRSKSWLMQQLGMARTTLWRLLNGPNRTIEDVQLVATALGVAPASLLPPSQRDAFSYELQESPPAAVHEHGTPRVMKGLPVRIRVWIQDFLLEITKIGVSEREVHAARALLEAPELHEFWRGGEPSELSEEDWILNLELAATAIRSTLKRRGYKVAAK